MNDICLLSSHFFPGAPAATEDKKKMALGTYAAWAAKRPWATAAATAGLMGLAGDSGAQALEAWRDKERPAAWSPSRASIIFAWSFTTQGVPMYEWFRALDAKWPTRPGLRGWAFWRPVFTKQVVHQACTCPVLNTGFLAFLSVWQRANDAETYAAAVERRWACDLVPLMTSSLGYWGLVHNAGFAFVQPRFRILYMCCAQVVWTLGISLFGFRTEGARKTSLS